jgi:hypothetical protein
VLAIRDDPEQISARVRNAGAPVLQRLTHTGGPMPSITDLAFSISPTSPGVSPRTLQVSYTAVFSPIEQFLAGNGLQFEERIQVIGDDSGEATDQPLHALPPELIALQAGQQAVARTRQIVVASGSLDEDPGSTPIAPGSPISLPNVDEVFARVEIAYVGLAPSTRADSVVIAGRF